ncbi:FadR/GntR family transcriptional regulator [Glaciibacter psychrotolerans]|uniref:DNA-binding FadR family transcriptional regulator n=1 Tax=Glaciibacter psychrotolerans TaxID=670054 RepID=A0A7Z0EFT5_9MICO|nr:FCD domain-containing protein [Leifsonia psychrotolerans]NYJ20876.1 DNA-binding FadR family transcriptional regulator [Leifsonia psychrotolerans]
MPAEPRAWELVLRHIEREMLDGALQPGDHLPPERTLAIELGVGRSSVREAVRVLEGFGLIRTQTGSGPRAGAIIIATPQGGMSALMRLQVAAQGFAVTDIVKTRLLLETQIVRGLADAVAPAALDAARLLLVAMDDPALSPAGFLALDAQFHVALAEASGNQVVTAIMAGLRDSVESYALAGLPALPDWRATAARLRSEHHHIVDAIDARDAASAGIRIHDHISGYYAETHLTGRLPDQLKESRPW